MKQDENGRNIALDYSQGLKFTVLRTMTLRSVKVQSEGTGTLVVRISETEGDLIETRSAAIDRAGRQRVSVGVTLLRGDYEISATGTSLSTESGLSWNWSGARVPHPYPYTVPGVVSITSSYGSEYGDLNAYNYFYDWEVSWQ